MIVNSLKNKVTIFGGKEDTPCTFNNKIVDITDSYKYLGVVFNRIQRCNGNVFSEMFNYSWQGFEGMFLLFKKCSKIGKVTPNICFQLFDSYVAPIIAYACDV